MRKSLCFFLFNVEKRPFAVRKSIKQDTELQRFRSVQESSYMISEPMTFPALISFSISWYPFSCS